MLQAQPDVFIARFVQFVDWDRGGGEADRKTFLTGVQPEPRRNVGLCRELRISMEDQRFAPTQESPAPGIGAFTS